MPNIYSKPISSGFRNTYQSQFVPLPLEQFAKTNELNQAKQDAEVAQLNATSDSAWKISGIADADNAYIAGIRNTVDKAAADLTNKDLTKRENQDAVRGLIKNISRDKDLATIMANKAKYDEYQKNKEESLKAGNYQAYNDNFIGSYNDYAKSGGYKSGKSLDTTIHKYSEERPKMEEYFNNMGENGSDTLAKAGEVYYQNGWSGISADRITNSKGTGRAQQAFDSYIVTPEGQQGVRRFNALAASNPKFAEQFKGGANEYVFKEFLDAGLERVHGKSSSGRAAALNTDANKKEDRAKEEANLGSFQSTGQNTVFTNGFTFDDSDYNEKGDFKGSGKGLWATIKDGQYTPAGLIASVVTAFKDNTFNKQDPRDQQKQLLQLAAHANGTSAQEYVNRHAGPDVKLTTDFKTIPTKKADAYQKQFFNTTTGTGVFDNVTVMNARTGEKGKLSEVLRLAAERGELKNAKGEVVKIEELADIRNAMLQMNPGIKGENESNYFSPKSLMLGVGNQEILWDRTNNGTYTEELVRRGELSKADVAKHADQSVRAAPKITQEKGETFIHFVDEDPKSETYGKVVKENVKNIK